ncbi:uncharacterized protein DUF2278 [Flavobacterium sp. 270]|uniref:DUF2278 family protein n=1 Tax=Flavobacterium sp. 270 TaxID=2512114 RepID=UPI00106634FA|nr:DUF2278 family protein [Flavobacterium sp. 270]TDW51669.1 uncharacterized protein DUF2278 [Flavobacterium sp. 270]
MPLDKYGVLKGTKVNYYRDEPDNFGNFYHGNVEVVANNINYRCAIDVDSQKTRVQWRIINFKAKEFNLISVMADGWHHLASNEVSGAIDYIRWKPMWVTLRIPILFLFPEWRLRIPPWLYSPKLKQFESSEIRSNVPFKIIVLDQSSFWKAGNNIDAIQQLESVLNQGDKVFIFGQFFNSGYGVHDIHQNQGDPINGGHSGDNAIWQDGATIVQKPDGNYVGFFNKFETQSFKTDNQGHPI